MRADRGALRGTAFGAIAWLALAGCGSYAPSGNQVSEVSERRTSAITNIDAVVCSAPGAPREWYSLTALNTMLKYSAGFRAAAGVDEVHDCTGARAAAKTYSSYEAQHPGFESTFPLQRSSRPLPPEPPYTPPTESKLISAETGNLSENYFSPVVQFEANWPGGYPGYVGDVGVEHCTGTFIAKNWILTAAHCLYAMPDYDESGALVDAGPSGYWTARINFFDSFGNFAHTVPTNQSRNMVVLQYAHPLYVGYLSPDPHQTIQNDIGLLYIGRAHDGDLAPGPVSTTGEPAWLGLLLASDPSANSEIWGAGVNDLGGTFLQKTSFGPAAPFSSDGTTIYGYATSNGPFICKGDSGGPVVDNVTRLSDSSNVSAIVTVSQSFETATGCGPGNQCACPNDRVRETRVDLFVHFIEDAMREWNGASFTCRDVPTTFMQPYLECWGEPCDDLTPCPDGKVCSRPGADLSSCTACGPGGGCGCIQGQCLPAP